jgi:hypothetical protein
MVDKTILIILFLVAFALLIAASGAAEIRDPRGIRLLLLHRLAGAARKAAQEIGVNGHCLSPN